MVRLSALPRRIRSRIAQVTRQLGRALQHDVQNNKLTGQVVKVRSNVLASSINRQFEENGGNFIATVGTDVPYAKILEFGVSRPWLIEARTAKTLRFAVGGRTLFRKRVLHPPVRERSFLRASSRDLATTIRAEYAHAAEEAIH